MEKTYTVYPGDHTSSGQMPVYPGGHTSSGQMSVSPGGHTSSGQMPVFPGDHTSSRQMPVSPGGHTSSRQMSVSPGDHTSSGQMPVFPGDHTSSRQMPVSPGDHTSSGQMPVFPGDHTSSRQMPVYPGDHTSSGQMSVSPGDHTSSRQMSVSPGGYTSSGQLMQQRTNRQNVPPDLVAAANTLKKYYDQRHTNPNIQRFFEDLFATVLGSNTNTGSSSGSQERVFSRGGGYTVKVHTVTTGETFGADEVLLRRVKNSEEFLLERTDQQSCNVIILFCPIISRVGSDVDAAMSKMSVSAGGKPVILVLMHHTRKVDYSTPEKKWSETFGKVVLDVDVLYHETKRGLLECPQNQKAVNQMQRQLLKYRGTVCRSEKSSNQSKNSDSCCIT